MKLSVGQIINVCHGKGKIIGFERFNLKGMSAPMSKEQSKMRGERVVCELLDGHTWSCDGYYYEFMTQVKELNKELSDVY